MTFEVFFQTLSPYILSALVAMQVWFLRQIMSVRETLVKLDIQKNVNETIQKDMVRQSDTAAIHSQQIASMELKLDLIIKKLDSVEQNCLLHRLMQRAEPEQLLKMMHQAHLASSP